MIYTELTKRAMNIAYERHHGQTDKSEVPYIFHPYHLAEQMGEDEYAVCVALLHDVVEDTNTSFKELSILFPEQIINALKLLTHDEQDDYLTVYIPAIKKNPLARKVKIADLLHNLDENRLPPPKNADEKLWNEMRIDKYKNALAILQY